MPGSLVQHHQKGHFNEGEDLLEAATAEDGGDDGRSDADDGGETDESSSEPESEVAFHNVELLVRGNDGPASAAGEASSGGSSSTAVRHQKHSLEQNYGPPTSAPTRPNIMLSLRDVHSSANSAPENVAVHQKYSREQDKLYHDGSPNTGYAPPTPSVEAAPPAPPTPSPVVDVRRANPAMYNSNQQGFGNCRSRDGLYFSSGETKSAARSSHGGVVLRYQYELVQDINDLEEDDVSHGASYRAGGTEHSKAPNSDELGWGNDHQVDGADLLVRDILPKLEEGISDALIPVFFDECLNVQQQGGRGGNRMLLRNGGRPEREPGAVELKPRSMLRQRRLNEVIGIDAKPDDFPLSQRECESTKNSRMTHCHRIEGALTLHFPPNYSIAPLLSATTLATLRAIEEGMMNGSLQQSHRDIRKLHFLSSSYDLHPEVLELEGAAKQSVSEEPSEGRNGGLVAGVVITLLLLGCCLSAAGFFYWKRRQAETDDDDDNSDVEMVNKDAKKRRRLSGLAMMRLSSGNSSSQGGLRHSLTSSRRSGVSDEEDGSDTSSSDSSSDDEGSTTDGGSSDDDDDGSTTTSGSDSSDSSDSEDLERSANVLDPIFENQRKRKERERKVRKRHARIRKRVERMKKKERKKSEGRRASVDKNDKSATKNNRRASVDKNDLSATKNNASSTKNNLVRRGSVERPPKELTRSTMTEATGMHSLSSVATEQVRNNFAPGSARAGNSNRPFELRSSFGDASTTTGATGVSAMTEATQQVANTARASRARSNGPFETKQSFGDDASTMTGMTGISEATELVANTAQSKNLKGPLFQRKRSSDDDASTMTGISEATELVANTAQARNLQGPLFQRKRSFGDEVSVMTGMSAATEQVANTGRGRVASVGDDVSSVMTPTSVMTGMSAATEQVSNARGGGATGRDDVSVMTGMSAATEKVGNGLGAAGGLPGLPPIGVISEEGNASF